MNPIRVEISYKTILFLVATGIGLGLFWQLRQIFFLFYICFILMAALNPTIIKLEKYKIPRALAILAIYVLVIITLAIVISGLVPILVDQTSLLINNIPASLDQTKILGFDINQIFAEFKLLDQLPSNLAKMTFSLVSNIFSLFVILVITFYLLLERLHIDSYSSEAFGQSWRNRIVTALSRIENRLGSWVNAEFILMTTIGLLSYIGYLVIGLPYALPMAVLAGLLEIVPNIGPTVSTLAAFFVGLTVSPLVGFIALGIGIVIQQLENNLIVPRIMKSTVGLNPLVTILLITSGAQLFNVIGAIIAIPTYLILETIISMAIDERNLSKQIQKTKQRDR